MRRELVLLVLLVCSCGTASPMPSATPPPGIEPEADASPMPSATPTQGIEPTEFASPLPSATPPPSIEPTEFASPLPTVTPSADIEAEEYAVLSALIRQTPIVGYYDPDSFIVIREQTVADLDMFERTVAEGADLPAELVDSYRSRNAASYTLGPELNVEQDYALMPDDEFTRILGRARPEVEMWDDFEVSYPGASGVMFLSRVGFDANGDRALALLGYRCPGLCGAGGLYLLVKEDGNWKVQSALYEWMS